ncbi:MAG: hypothetical protein ACLR23_26260 [Clostridia bacterium]
MEIGLAKESWKWKTAAILESAASEKFTPDREVTGHGIKTVLKAMSKANSVAISMQKNVCSRRAARPVSSDGFGE